MLGLMYIGAAALYLAITVLAVRWAWRAGRAGGGSLVKGLGFASSGLLLSLLPVLWAVVPTVLAHRHFCATDAGFRERITPELWAKQNPDLIVRLQGRDLVRSSKTSRTADGFDRSMDFDGARAWDSRVTTARQWSIDVLRLETRIVDTSSGTVLVESVDYQTGSREHIAFWLTRQSCFDQGASPADELIQYSRHMKGLIK